MEIPANTSASIFIPATNAEAITENEKSLSWIKEITVTGRQGDYMVLQTGSGIYHFSTALVK